MKMNRALLSIGGVAYALFHATLGLLWASEYQNSAAAYLSIGIYVVLALATMLLYRGMKIPLIQAVITVAGLLVIPPLSQSQLDLQHLTDYSTWYVMGIGTVLSAVALRRHVILAIVGMCAAIIEIMVWAGWQNFFASGLLGAIMLLAGTAVVTIGLRRAEAETSAFAEQNERSVAEAAAVLAAGEQRSKMMLETLTRSKPLLEAIASGKTLNPDERTEARLTESALRDEIRGRQLLNSRTRDAVNRARRRGVAVSLLDEGGLGNLDEAKVEVILAQVAEALDSLDSGKVTIRAPKGEAWVVTVAAFDDGIAEPKVWLRLSPEQTAG